MKPDRFAWNARLEDWLFMVALGIGLGAGAAGAYRWRGGHRLQGVFFILAGCFLILGCALAVLDRSPVDVVLLRVKPLASTVTEALALASGVLLGAIAAFVAFFLAFRPASRRGDIAGATVLVICVAATAALLWKIDDYTTDPTDRRHPAGMLRPAAVPATRVIEGLSIPTGLAIGPNGDLATVDLFPPRLRVFRPSAGGFEQVHDAALRIPEGGQGFHVAFHPQYPDVPLLYVSAERKDPAGNALHVLLVDLASGQPKFTTVIDGLPIGPSDEPGTHYGSGLTFCGEFFFVGTSDTEPGRLHPRVLHDPEVRRSQAQSMASAVGKILRYRLSGETLAPAGFGAGAVPVYAFGFRNPFGVGCDRATGQPLVADNGPNGYDQLRLIAPGENAEWPLSAERNTLRDPVYITGRTPTAPTGVTSRPSAEGGVEAIISTFESGALYAITYDSDGRATGKLRLLREVDGGAYAVASDANGCVYFTDVEAVWRLDDGHCGP